MKQILFCLLFTMGHVASAYDSYQTFRAKPLSLNLDLKYYKTDANFNADGDRVDLVGSNSFQHIKVAPYLRYQFTTDFALLGGFNYGISESTDFLFTRKNSELNQIDLAAEYLFINDLWFRMFGRMAYSQNLKKIDYSTDSVLTSDGANLVHPEVVINLDLDGGIYSYLKAGLLFRTEELSTLATYGVGSEVRFSDFGIGASLLGSLSIKDDGYTNQSAYRDNYNNLANGGSKYFNSVNPNTHQVELNFNFLMSKQSLFKVLAGFDVLGSNSAAGFYIGTTVNWIFDFMPERRSKPQRSEERPQQPAFKTNTDDGVDQSIFKTISKPEYSNGTVGDDGETVNTKAKKKKNPEYKIKLKKKKKKQQ